MHRYPAADGIRGLACLLVLCTHLPGFFLPDYGKYVTGTGKYGVWLFFVLSAFLLTSRLKPRGLARERCGVTPSAACCASFLYSP